jgi:hypothetical protein
MEACSQGLKQGGSIPLFALNLLDCVPQVPRRLGGISTHKLSFPQLHHTMSIR